MTHYFDGRRQPDDPGDDYDRDADLATIAAARRAGIGVILLLVAFAVALIGTAFFSSTPT